MGAWGYGPFDSDAAGDWMDPIDRRIADAFDAALSDRASDNEYAVAYAAAGMLVALMEHGHGNMDLYERGEHALEAILADEEFVRGWKNPRQFEKKVSEYIDVLDRKKRSERTRLRKLYGPSGSRRR